MKVLTSILIMAMMVMMVGCSAGHNQKVATEESLKNKPAESLENSTGNTAESHISVDVLENLLKHTNAIVTKDEKGILKATFKDSMTFARESAELKQGVKAEIRAIAEALKKFPDSKIRVIGHTDKRGAADYNMDLSVKRAHMVRTELVNSGYTGDIEAVGFGETRLISDIDAENRRVEIEFNNIAGIFEQKQEIPAESPVAAKTSAVKKDAAKKVVAKTEIQSNELKPEVHSDDLKTDAKSIIREKAEDQAKAEVKSEAKKLGVKKEIPTESLDLSKPDVSKPDVKKVAQEQAKNSAETEANKKLESVF